MPPKKSAIQTAREEASAQITALESEAKQEAAKRGGLNALDEQIIQGAHRDVRNITSAEELKRMTPFIIKGIREQIWKIKQRSEVPE